MELTEMMLEKDVSEIGPELQQSGTTLYIALRLNSAQACLKQNEWDTAVGHAEKVLLVDKDNCKALYRRALACMQFDNEGRLEQARTDLTRVVQQEPGNREARDRLQQAKDQLREVRQREKDRYASALQGGGLYQDQHAKHAKRVALYEEESKRR